MAEAANASADAAGSSPGAAQGSQSPPQPGDASSNAASQPASDTNSWLHGLLNPEHLEAEHASSFISALGTAHHCDRLREERDALYQQLAMRLTWGRRSAQSDSLLTRLRQELPADACAGASDRGMVEAVFDQMNSVLAPLNHEVEPGCSAPMPPALAAPPLSHAVAAQFAAPDGVLAELGQTMLARASRDEGVIMAAKATINYLEAEGLDEVLPEAIVDAMLHFMRSVDEAAVVPGEPPGAAEGLCAEEGSHPVRTASTSSSETRRSVASVAGSDRATAQVLAARAPAGSASAQAPKAGATGPQTAGSRNRARSRARGGKAVEQREQHPACAAAQRVHDNMARVERAADALDAKLMEAAQAVPDSRQAFEFFQPAFIYLLQSCCDDAYVAAQQLYRRASAWRAAQDARRETLAWAVTKTLAQLDAIRTAWRRELECSLADQGVGGEVELTELPAGACAVLQRFSDGYARMEGCLEMMQKRVAGYVRSETERQQDMAAATYVIIRLAVTMGPPGLRRASHESSSGLAAQTAAARSCVTPDAHCKVAVGPSSAQCSVAAVSSSRLVADMRQGGSKGQPALVRQLDGVAERLSSSVRPAVGETGAVATTMARQRFLRAWRGLLGAHEPSLDAQSAADDRMASLIAAAAERADAARMQTCPLPRMTGKCMREKAAACAASMRAKTAAASRVLDSRIAAMTQARSLESSCASLISAAHAAGVAWLSSSGVGPGLAAGQAWCMEFVEVSVGVHGAKVQAHAAALPCTKAVSAAFFAKLADATAAAISCVEEGLVKADSDRAAALVQEFCRAQAAFESFENDRLALLQGAKAEADRALVRLQREHARAQALEARMTAALAEVESRQQREAMEHEAAERALKKKAKKARRQQAKAAAAQAAHPSASEPHESTASNIAQQDPTYPQESAGTSRPHGQQSQAASECSLTAEALSAGGGRPDQGQQAGGENLSPAGILEERDSNVHQGQRGHGCAAGAANGARKQLPAATSDADALLCLLLPGLAIAEGLTCAAATAAPNEASSALPAEAAPTSAPAPAALPLDSSSATRMALELELGGDAAAQPGEQRQRLRAFVHMQLWSADMEGATDAPWPEPPACNFRVTDSGLREGGLAERLFRRMGSTPDAAALLRSLVCPITKDFAQDAVVASDGCTYDREAFRAWMQQSSTSPTRRQRPCSTRKNPPYKNRLYSATVGMMLQER